MREVESTALAIALVLVGGLTALSLLGTFAI
jgi:hypothetical protein